MELEIILYVKIRHADEYEFQFDGQVSQWFKNWLIIISLRGKILKSLFSKPVEITQTLKNAEENTIIVKMWNDP